MYGINIYAWNVNRTVFICVYKLLNKLLIEKNLTENNLNLDVPNMEFWKDKIILEYMIQLGNDEIAD